MLQQAEEALYLTVNLTTQLLTFSKGGKPVKKLMRLEQVIESAVKFALSGSHTDYRMDVAADLWPVEADEGQLTQVIQNIVLNADEAMAGRGTVTVSVRNAAYSQRDDSRTARRRPFCQSVNTGFRHRHIQTELGEDLRSVLHDETERQRPWAGNVLFDYKEPRRHHRGAIRSGQGKHLHDISSCRRGSSHGSRNYHINDYWLSGREKSS